MTMSFKKQSWLDRFPALHQAWTQGQARWGRLAQREQRLVTWTLVGLGALIFWNWLIAPPLQTLQTTQARLAQMDREWAQMQFDASQVRTLRSAAPVSPDEAEAALRAASERLGANARLTLQGERATLQLTGIAGTALAAWLAEVRLGARARPTEANLSRANGVYSGSVIVTLPMTH
jgi:general secretion pathway protein M